MNTKNHPVEKEINVTTKPGYYHLAWEIMETGFKGFSSELNLEDALKLKASYEGHQICLGNKLVDVVEATHIEIVPAKHVLHA
jgi:hypothetical protein